MPSKLAWKTHFDKWMIQHELANSDVAHVIGTTREAVRLWREGLRRANTDLVAALNKSELAIPKYVMRPDIWPAPSKRPKQRKRAAVVKAAKRSRDTEEPTRTAAPPV